MVIVSFNRQKQVNEAIDSLLNQSIKPFEIIVIDDGSSHPLDLKVNSKNLKLIRFDKEQGLSNARNYGATIAKGEYIAFIDDDAVASKNWLDEIQKGIKKGADILGGSIEPLFKAKPPNWWSVNDFGLYASVGNSETQRIWGANMIFKKDVFEKNGFFNPKIGRQQGKLFGCEEVDLIYARSKGNCRILFLPNAKVFHAVKSERMSLRYILKWSYFTGKSFKTVSRHRTRMTLGTCREIIITMLVMLNPLLMINKTSRIKKIAKLSGLLGAVF